MKTFPILITALMLAASCGMAPQTIEDDGSSLPENCLVMGETTIKGKINGYFPSLTEDRRVKISVGNPLDFHTLILRTDPDSDGEFEIRIPITCRHQTIRIQYLALNRTMMVTKDSTQIVDFDIWNETFFHKESAVIFSGANKVFNNGLGSCSPTYQTIPDFYVKIPGNRAEMDFETYRNYIDSICLSDMDRIERAGIPNIVKEWARINIEGKRINWFCNINSYPYPDSGENDRSENAEKAVEYLSQLPATDHNILYYQDLNCLQFTWLFGRPDNAEGVDEASLNDMVDEVLGQKHRLLCQFSRNNYIKCRKCQNHDSAMMMLRNIDNPFFAEYFEWKDGYDKKQWSQSRGSYADHKPMDSKADSLIVELMRPHIGRPTVMHIFQNSWYFSPIFEAESFDSVSVSEAESRFMERGVDFVYVTSRRSPEHTVKELRERLKGDCMVIDNKDYNLLEDKLRHDDIGTTLFFDSNGEMVTGFSNSFFMSDYMRREMEGLL